MKILLMASDGPGFAETNITGIYPPLGLAYIASVLRTARYKVFFLDNRILCLNRSALKDKIKEISPDMVLLSSMTPLWPASIALSRLIKDISPAILVGVGGPHLSVYPEESLSIRSLDFGVYGEGENTILDVLKTIEDGGTPDNVRGCIFRKNGKVVVNAPREAIDNLDSIPFPAVDLFPYKEYFALSVRQPFFTMITSRGCPYTCNFCYQGYLGRYRSRSPENVVEEMEILINKYQIKELILFDETFAVIKERALKICGLIRKKNMKFKWDIRTRVDLLDEEVLKSLRSAGCSRIHLGIESGDNETLQRMRKGIDIEGVVRKVNLAKKFGFELRGYFMLAYPGETCGGIHRTIEFAKNLPLDWASFTITIGLPETNIYNEGLDKRYFYIDYWKEYAKGNILSLKPYFIPDGLDEEELYRLKRRAYLEFYLRPRIVWNILKGLKLVDIARNFRVFVKLLPAAYHSMARI